MKKSNGPFKAIMFVGVIGMDLSITTVGGFWLGQMLDRWQNTEPLFLIAGVLSGLALGIYTVVLLIKPFIGDRQ